MYYVYILRCSDDKLYVGQTSYLKKRIERHQNGYLPSTKPRRPVFLIYYSAFSDQYKAIEFEKYLKSGSGRAFTSKHLI
ncbi:MAG: GIY-YIG nuclease family protein [Prolixibacteraceae bacterium]|nr:GIY-YIG nuclease family protein [Prolixibacteraceae bacterium]